MKLMIVGVSHANISRLLGLGPYDNHNQCLETVNDIFQDLLQLCK